MNLSNLPFGIEQRDEGVVVHIDSEREVLDWRAPRARAWRSGSSALPPLMAHSKFTTADERGAI